MYFHTERQEVAICNTKPCYICNLYALEFAGEFCHKQLVVDVMPGSVGQHSLKYAHKFLMFLIGVGVMLS